MRLNNRAFKILAEEAKRCASRSQGDVQYGIVLKRLEKLRLQSGSPVSKEELRATVMDMFPDFSSKAIDAADRANHPSKILGIIKSGTIGLVVCTGLLWVVNLPYPPIRRPIAQTAPLLLLPSFFNMDRNYRGAISKVEQADQLINQATSSSDILLGEEKISQSQKHLDALPVWFLGYEPQRYCTFFSCSWRFTLDEFETARKAIGRAEAKVFQEKNALTQLQETETTLEQAKQKYLTTTATEKENAIASWQTALQTISLIPPTTFAGKQAQQKFNFYREDFEKNVGKFETVEKAGTFLDVAKQFAWQAAKMSQNPPHSAAKWQQITGFWEEAIAQLEKVDPQDKASYIQAQTKIAEYRVNLSQVKLKQEEEQASVQAIERAKNQIQNLLASTPDNADRVNRPQTAAIIQGIINELQKVQPGTTVSSEAQELIEFAKAKLKELQ
ncbi:hypothetical protein [Spirulina sp. 06S082]|uniref:hypothetical protein n=1 Tax=Spirulina sp. 06S082 TaxID=3110248 RepID=UPI002B2147F0|nr:hypothetical protein [Spirulina sp. 06S082]MEA5470512.1 hypothetical protein [Spirulina sp. 06S082]